MNKSLTASSGGTAYCVCPQRVVAEPARDHLLRWRRLVDRVAGKNNGPPARVVC
jgi:hypothetical protein